MLLDPRRRHVASEQRATGSAGSRRRHAGTRRYVTDAELGTRLLADKASSVRDGDRCQPLSLAAVQRFSAVAAARRGSQARSGVGYVDIGTATANYAFRSHCPVQRINLSSLMVCSNSLVIDRMTESKDG